MPSFRVFVTYDYVDVYEVTATSAEDARAAYERGEAEHVETHPPERRRVAVRTTVAWRDRSPEEREAIRREAGFNL